MEAVLAEGLKNKRRGQPQLVVVIPIIFLLTCSRWVGDNDDCDGLPVTASGGRPGTRHDPNRLSELLWSPRTLSQRGQDDASRHDAILSPRTLLVKSFRSSARPP